MLNPYQEQTSFTEAIANAFISLVESWLTSEEEEPDPEITNSQKGDQTQVRSPNAMWVALTKCGAAPHTR